MGIGGIVKTKRPGAVPGFDYCSIALDLLSTCLLLNTASSAAATATATAAAAGKKRVETLAILDPR